MTQVFAGYHLASQAAATAGIATAKINSVDDEGRSAVADATPRRMAIHSTSAGNDSQPIKLTSGEVNEARHSNCILPKNSIGRKRLGKE